MSPWLLVAIGSALGGVARHGCTLWMATRFGTTFPWGTLLVNVIGSAIIGVVAALTGDSLSPAAQSTREFVMVGILGGYTTFSSFSLQTFDLMRDGRWFDAGGYVLLSVIVCMIAVALGFAAGRAVTGH